MFKIDHSKTFARLPNAPIVEAVIQLVAAPAEAWNQEELKAKLASRFPDYELKTIHRMAAHFQIASSAEKSLEIQEDWDGFRLTSVDGRYVSQFKPDNVIVSRLAPYEDWERFTDVASLFWNVYLELAKPVAIDRIGVRFISKIDLKEDESPGDFVDDAPATLTAIGLVAESFFHKDTFPTTGRPFTVDLTRTIQIQEPPLPRKALIVDIDVTTTVPVAPNELKSRLQDMRFIKNEIFFAFMKDVEKKFS